MAKVGISGTTLLGISNINCSDVNINLGDKAGANKFYVKDSDGAAVASIDSDGNASCYAIIASGSINSPVMEATNDLIIRTNNAAKTIQFRNSAAKVCYKRIEVKQTTNATPTVVASIAVPEGYVCMITANVVARKSDGSQRAAYFLLGCFYRNSGGNVTQQGATSKEEFESDASWDADLVATVATQTADIVVTGVADTTINWKLSMEYTFQNDWV